MLEGDTYWPGFHDVISLNDIRKGFLLAFVKRH